MCTYIIVNKSQQIILCNLIKLLYSNENSLIFHYSLERIARVQFATVT